MAEQIYFKGIRTFEPRKGAPEFVLGTGVINVMELHEWIDTQSEHFTKYNGADQLRFNITKTKDGRIAFTVDPWKPDGNRQSAPAQESAPASDNQPLIDDSLPF